MQVSKLKVQTVYNQGFFKSTVLNDVKKYQSDD